MAESTLSIAWKQLQARIGSFLGWGRGALYNDTPWTDYQQFELDGITESGLRNFYFPKAMEGSTSSYDWSFLRPVSTLDFPAGVQTVLLPDDCGGVEDQVSILTNNSTAQPWFVEWRNEAQIRQMYSITPDMTGPPMFVAEQALKGTGPTQSSRNQLFFFPTSDQDYTIQLSYYVNPDKLSPPFPYAYGGAQHSETILESCLAVAEKRLDDAASVHAAAFEERLQASISMDRRNKPQKIGYNRDRSDSLDRTDRSEVHWWAPAATYNGSSFS